MNRIDADGPTSATDLFRRTYKVARSWKLELLGAVTFSACVLILSVGLLTLRALSSLPAPTGLDPGHAPLLELWSSAKTLLCESSKPLVLLILIPTLLLCRLVYAPFAGAVMRGCVENFCRSPRPPSSKHHRFVRRRLTGFVMPPVILLLGAALLFLLLLLLALLGDVPWIGPALLVLLSPLLLIQSALICTMVLGWLWGSPLMLAATAVEGRSIVDALSRSFHYGFGDPLRYFALSMRGAGFAVISFGVRLIVSSLSFAILLAAFSMTSEAGLWGRTRGTLYSLFDGSQPDDSAGAIEWILAGYGVLLALMAVGHLLAHRAAHQGVTYALLRRSIDGTPVYDIAKDEREAPEPTLTAQDVGLTLVAEEPVPKEGA